MTSGGVPLTYEEFIQNILDTRGRFNCGDEYHERHHILPKCMGGTNDEENLIDLFAKEHIIAHRLLALENPNNDSLVYAWHMMSVINDNQHRYELTPEEYEEAKIAISKLKLGKSHSIETIKKLSDAAKERLNDPENHPWYGRHHKEETKSKMSRSKKELYSNVANHPMYGKHPTEESKEKNRQSHLGKKASEETRKKMSKSRKGRFLGENSPCSKKILQFNTDGEFIREFNSLHEIERILGYSRTPIIRCCKHKPHCNTAYGFIWMYKEEYERVNNINGGNNGNE